MGLSGGEAGLVSLLLGLGFGGDALFVVRLALGLSGGEAGLVSLLHGLGFGGDALFFIRLALGLGSLGRKPPLVVRLAFGVGRSFQPALLHEALLLDLDLLVAALNLHIWQAARVIKQGHLFLLGAGLVCERSQAAGGRKPRHQEVRNRGWETQHTRPHLLNRAMASSELGQPPASLERLKWSRAFPRSAVTPRPCSRSVPRKHMATGSPLAAAISHRRRAFS